MSCGLNSHQHDNPAQCNNNSISWNAYFSRPNWNHATHDPAWCTSERTQSIEAESPPKQISKWPTFIYSDENQDSISIASSFDHRSIIVHQANNQQLTINSLLSHTNHNDGRHDEWNGEWDTGIDLPIKQTLHQGCKHKYKHKCEMWRLELGLQTTSNNVATNQEERDHRDHTQDHQFSNQSYGINEIRWRSTWKWRWRWRWRWGPWEYSMTLGALLGSKVWVVESSFARFIWI